MAHRQVGHRTGETTELVEDGGDPVGIDGAVVHRDRRRLLLDRETGMRVDERGQADDEVGPPRPDHRVELLGESDVELRAVGADEVDLRGQPRERREVAQGASRDHGDVGLGQRGEVPQRHAGLAQREGSHRVVDDRGDRAVVVARHEQVGGLGEPVEARRQLVIEGGALHDAEAIGRGATFPRVTSPGSSTDAAACYRHHDRRAGVICQRCDRPICTACMHQASVGFHCPECVKGSGQRVFRGPPVFDPIVTKVLIGINVAAWLASTAQSGTPFAISPRLRADGGLFASLVVQGQQHAVGVAEGQWYRLVSSGFLHDGLLHLGFNMYALWVLGPSLERLLGRGRFVGLYGASLLGGALGALLLSPDSPTVGASGALFGLFGAVAVFQRAGGQSLWRSGIGQVLLLNLLFTFAVPGISIGGHVGGMIANAAVGGVSWPCCGRANPWVGVGLAVAGRCSSSRRSTSRRTLSCSASGERAARARRLRRQTHRRTGAPSAAPIGPPIHQGKRSSSLQAKRVRSPASGVSVNRPSPWTTPTWRTPMASFGLQSVISMRSTRRNGPMRVWQSKVVPTPSWADEVNAIRSASAIHSTCEEITARSAHTVAGSAASSVVTSIATIAGG
ncbi:MAG: rhomboid family intramembrane serine protease [Acidimicrobiales bacterium]